MAITYLKSYVSYQQVYESLKSKTDSPSVFLVPQTKSPLFHRHCDITLTCLYKSPLIQSFSFIGNFYTISSISSLNFLLINSCIPTCSAQALIMFKISLSCTNFTLIILSFFLRIPTTSFGVRSSIITPTPFQFLSSLDHHDLCSLPSPTIILALSLAHFVSLKT